MTTYRYNIGLDKKYNFGTEIEFAGINLNIIYKNLIKNGIDTEYILDHKIKNCTFEKWVLDIDSSISMTYGKDIIGGELSIKIFKDQKTDWLELKKVCEVLKQSNAQIDQYCSNQITIDANNFYNNKKFLETLYKMILVYEKELETFYMGDKYYIRKGKDLYAKSMQKDLLEKMDTIDFDKDYIFNSNKRLLNIIYNPSPTFMGNQGINLQKLLTKHLIEIRYPNGSLNEKTIQNNINFSLKLIDSILENKFDKDLLEYEVTKIKNDFNLKLDKTKFYQLTEIISQNSNDKDDFEEQFQKVLKSK